MKRVYLIHGWGGNANQGAWFGWLKNALKEKGIEVFAFDMPNTDEPTIESWVGFLKENIKEVDEETFFVGHSIGCQTILRYLQDLDEEKKIGGCVFVAGWFHLIDSGEEAEEDMALAKPWVETPIYFEKIKNHCDNFLSVFSDDDWYVPLSDSDLFKEKLNSEIIIKKQKGHFETEEEIPEIVDFVLKN